MRSRCALVGVSAAVVGLGVVLSLPARAQVAFDSLTNEINTRNLFIPETTPVAPPPSNTAVPYYTYMGQEFSAGPLST
jgi:hypothetical protein